MSADLYAAFIAISIVLILVPGPSILLIVSTSLGGGTRAGLAAVAGTSLGMFLQLLLAGLATASVLAGLAEWSAALRWAGTAYLLYLAWQSWRGSPGPHSGASRPVIGGPFANGLVVSAVNPTTLLFFVAFFPQFVTPAAAPRPQLVALSLSFLLLALIVDIGYAAGAGRVAHLLADPQRAWLRGRVAGATLCLAAVLTAFYRGSG